MPDMQAQLRGMIAGSKTRVELWSQVLQAAETRTMAELGVWRGNFARKMLEACGFLELYYMVDPWAYLPEWNRAKNVQTENFEEIFQEAMAGTAFAEGKRRVLRGTTKDMIGNIPNQSLDFAYVDGDHTLRGVTIDLIKVLPKLKPGGLIGGDDFMPKPWPNSPKFEPTMVCPYAIYFAEAHDLPIYSLPYNQFLIEARPGAGFAFNDLVGLYGDISLARAGGGGGGGAARQGRLKRRAARQAKQAMKAMKAK